MTNDGDFVLAEDGGLINIPEGVKISVDESGRITADGQEIAQLQLVDFEDYNYLKKNSLQNKWYSATITTKKTSWR